MEALKSELTCPICLQLYTSPVGLPCSHSACLKCIRSLLSSNCYKSRTAEPAIVDGPSKDYLLSCPVCNETLNAKMNQQELINQLPANKLLQNIVDRYRVALDQVGGVGNEGDVAARGDSQHVTEEEEVPPDCDMCEVEEGGAVQVATKWCVECTVLYCDQCFAQCHRMKGPFAAHTIKPPPASSAARNNGNDDVSSTPRLLGQGGVSLAPADVIKCDVHVDEKINMYCIACDQLICALCKLVGGHKEHEVNDLNTCYRLKRDTLASNCDKLVETSLALTATLEQLNTAQQHFTESRALTEEQLNDCFDELEKLLAKRKRVLFTQLSTHYNDREQQVSQTSQAVRNNLDSVHSLLSFTDEAMKETDPISFLLCSNFLSKRVLEACEQGADIEKKCCAFKPDTSGDETNQQQNERLFVDFAREKSLLRNLNFLKPPGVVQVDASFCVCKSTSLVIRWNNNSAIPVSEYHVIYRHSGSDHWVSCQALDVAASAELDQQDTTTQEEEEQREEEEEDMSFVGGACEVCIEDLEADTEYEVCVIAVNLAGQSPDDEHNSLFLRTALPVPKTPSVDEDECVVERNTILFKWTSDLTLVTSSSKTAPEECMVSFVVEYKKETEGGGDDQSGESGGRWSSRRHMESTEVTLDQLAYNTAYLLRVKAVSSTGSSDFSPPIALTTWPLPPETPVILEEHCRGQGNKYQLQWTCCPQPEGEGDREGQCSERGRGERSADSYTVEYRPMQRGNDWVAYEGISLCHCHLKDLLYDTEYSVRVKALNISGESEYSDSIVIRTGSAPIKFSLDEETAHVNLKLTSGNCCAVYDRAGAKSRNAVQSSFIGASFSVLGDLSVLKGKHYWETKVKTKSSDRIGVAYQSTARDCLIGDSDKSWAVGFLASEDGKLCCFHNKKKKRLTLQMTSSAKAVTVGTLLDLDDGYVAFFLSELNQHLHSFKVNFCEPVYPAFSVWPADMQVSSGLPVPDWLLL